MKGRKERTLGRWAWLITKALIFWVTVYCEFRAEFVLRSASQSTPSVILCLFLWRRGGQRTPKAVLLPTKTESQVPPLAWPREVRTLRKEKASLCTSLWNTEWGPGWHHLGLVTIQQWEVVGSRRRGCSLNSVQQGAKELKSRKSNKTREGEDSPVCKKASDHDNREKPSNNWRLQIWA